MKLLLAVVFMCFVQKCIFSTFFEKKQSRFMHSLNEIFRFLLYFSLPWILVFNVVKFIVLHAEPIFVYLVSEAENLLTSDNLTTLQSLPIVYNVFNLAPMEILVVSIISIGCSVVLITGCHFILDVKKLECSKTDPVIGLKKWVEWEATCSARYKKIFLELCQLRN